MEFWLMYYNGQKPTRLLYVQPAEVFGGAEQQGVLQMRMLAEYGFEVVPVIGPGKMILPSLKDQGIYNYIFFESFCHEPYYPLTALGQASYITRFLRDWVVMQKKLLRVARENHIDLVFANRSTGWVAGSWVAHHLGVPLIWRAGGRLTKSYEALSLGLFSRIWGPDALICNCEAVQATLLQYVDCPSYVINNGIDHHRFDPSRIAPNARLKFGLDDKMLVVGFPSRPAPEKGLEFLAEVVKMVVPRVPNMRVIIAGEFGWRPYYEKLFAKIGLDNHVFFVGHIQDIESFYQICNVVVLTSKTKSIEGSPNAVLEAMAMKCPIVATQVGGVEEAIHHGVEGFLVPPDNAELFANYLITLLSDQELRRRMGAAGRATILEKFNYQNTINQVANVLGEVLLNAQEKHLNQKNLLSGRVAGKNDLRLQT